MFSIKNWPIRAALIVALASVGTAFAKDGDLKTEGTIQELSSSSIVVGGNQYLINSATEFEDSAGNEIPRASFKVGSRVEIKWSFSGASRLAREMELLGTAVTSPSSTPTPTKTPSGSRTSSQEEDHGGNRRSAHDDHNGSRRTNVLRARLLPNIASQARGAATDKSKVDGKKSDDRFRIKVKIPVGTVPSVADEAEASGLSLSATLSRSGNAYAICQLDFSSQDDDEDTSSPFEFSVDVRVKVDKKGRIRARNSRGACDTDLSAVGVQNGLPVVQAGDGVTVGEETLGSFLSGTFR